MIIATTLTMLSELPKNVCEIGAPKIVAAPALETSAAVKTPRGTPCPIPFKTPNKAKKIGA